MESSWECGIETSVSLSFTENIRKKKQKIKRTNYLVDTESNGIIEEIIFSVLLKQFSPRSRFEVGSPPLCAGAPEHKRRYSDSCAISEENFL